MTCSGNNGLNIRNRTGPGVRMSKLPLLASRTRRCFDVLCNRIVDLDIRFE